MQRSYKLAVLRFPGMNQEHPASSGWIIAHMQKWAKDKRISSVIPLRRSDTPITMVRNLLVKKALDEGADYILMIDADMQPDVEPDGKPFWDSSWAFMMERREREEAHHHSLLEAFPDNPGLNIAKELCHLYPPATIAAPYCGPPPDECVYVAKWTNFEGNTISYPRPYALRLFDRDHAAMFGGIFEVAALATGLILYDARVFRRLPPPWFNYEFTDDFQTEKATTEDIYQTRNAAILGMPQFCNWDAWAGHIKSKVVRRPRPLDVSKVPALFAQEVRKGTGGSHKVVVLRSPDDLPSRPIEMPGIATKADTVSRTTPTHDAM